MRYPLTEYKTMLCKAAFLLFALAGVAGQVSQPLAVGQPAAESTLYRVSFEGMEPNPQGESSVVLRVFRKPEGDTKFLRYPSRAVKVTRLFFVKESRLVVWGELGSRGDIVTIVDVGGASVVDTIWAWQFTLDVDANLAVYRFRYPPHSIESYDSLVVLAYDFNQSPMANSRSPDSLNPDGTYNPENRGFILYPEANRSTSKYFIPAMLPNEQRFIRSPFAWCESRRKLAFLELIHGTMFVISIDLTGGLSNPLVQRSELDVAPFYRPEYMQDAPERWKERGFVASSMLFLPGCQSLEMTTSGGEVFQAGRAIFSLDGKSMRP